MPYLLFSFYAIIFLFLGYLPFYQLTFLQKFQYNFQIHSTFLHLIILSAFFSILGVMSIFIYLKFIKKKYLLSKASFWQEKSLSVSFFSLLVGATASIFTLTFCLFYYIGLDAIFISPEPWSAAEVKQISVHEAGHALVREYQLPGSTINATIVDPADINKSNQWFDQTLPRGYVAGKPPARLSTKADLLKSIDIYLAGIEAEKLIYKDSHTSIGAKDDLKQVQEIIIALCNNGLYNSQNFTWNMLTPQDQQKIYHDILARESENVRSILITHQKELLSLATLLQREHSLTGEEIRKVIR